MRVPDPDSEADRELRAGPRKPNTAGGMSPQDAPEIVSEQVGVGHSGVSSKESLGLLDEIFLCSGATQVWGEHVRHSSRSHSSHKRPASTVDRTSVAAVYRSPTAYKVSLEMDPGSFSCTASCHTTPVDGSDPPGTSGKLAGACFGNQLGGRVLSGW